MALPSSGPLSISQIRAILGTSSGSLRYLSSLAGKSTPDAISEFYGYQNVTYYSFGPMAPYDPCNGYGQYLYWTNVDPTVRFSSGADANGNYVFIPQYYADWEYAWVWDMYYVMNNNVYYWGITYSGCGPY